MTDILKGTVIDALGKVIYPDQNKDLITLKMVKDIKIDKKNIRILIELTNQDPNLKDKLENDCFESIKSVAPDAEKVDIEFSANTPGEPIVKSNSLLSGVKNTIAVASGKGGVGKSTVAVNLALSLAKEGAKVGLLDADIYGPSVPLMLGIEGKPKTIDLGDSTKMLPLEKYGLKVISIGFFVDDNTPVIWRGPMASGAIKQFMQDVYWEELDYLIFDLPPGTGDIQLTLVQTIPLSGAIIVTTPQEVSLVDARKGLQMFSKVNVPVYGIVENMSYFIAPDTGNKYDIFGSGGGEKLSKDLKTTFLGGIPIDSRVREGGDAGRPIVDAYPDSEQAQIIMQIARNLIQRVTINNAESSGSEVEISI